MDPFVRVDSEKPRPAPGKRVLAPEDYLVFASAQDLLAWAESRARQIEDEAKAAFLAEHERGYKEGMVRAQGEISEQMLTMVSRSVDYLASAESQVAKTVIMCLRKILGEIPEEDLVIATARNALSVVQNESRVTLAVRPEVQEEVRGRIGEVLKGQGGIGFLEVVSDQGLERGGCRLETEVGVVDASIESQISAIERVFKDRLKSTFDPVG